MTSLTSTQQQTIGQRVSAALFTAWLLLLPSSHVSAHITNTASLITATETDIKMTGAKLQADNIDLTAARNIELLGKGARLALF